MEWSWFKSTKGVSEERLKTGVVRKTRRDVVLGMEADVKENINTFTATIQAKLQERTEHYWKKGAKPTTQLQYRFDYQYPRWREIESIYDHTTPMEQWFKAEEYTKKQEAGTYVRLKEMYALRLEVSSPELRNAAGYIYFLPYIDLTKMKGWWVMLQAKKDKEENGGPRPYTTLVQRYQQQRQNRKNFIQEFDSDKIVEALLLLADFGPFRSFSHR